MEKSTYHNRLFNLLSNTSSKVIRRMFLFLIESHTDYRDLNHFLQKKEKEMKRKHIVKINYKILFPTRNQPTELDKWDLQLLCFIVCNIFKPEGIDQLYVHIIDLKTIRNSLCHGSSTYISKDDYEEYVRKIRQINDEFLCWIGDQNFEREIADETDDIIHDKLDISGALETILDWYELDESHKERCTFDKVHRMALEKLNQNPPTGTATTPEIKLILKVESCVKEQEINISKRLADVINSKRLKSEVLNPPTDTETAELSRIAEEAFIEILDEGQVVVKADVGCVILTVKSGSFASIEQLWTKCMNGELIKAFDTLQSHLRRIYKNHVELEVIVPEHEFWEVIDTIEESLESPGQSCLEGKVMDVITPHSSENGTEIEMVIQPHSEKQLEHMEEYNASGQLDASLNKMAKRLEEQFHLKMLTISSKFIVQGTKGNSSFGEIEVNPNEKQTHKRYHQLESYEYTFEPDKELRRKSSISTPVELHERPSGNKVKATHVRNINVTKKSNTWGCDVTGLVVISRDIMVVCDSDNSSVKLIDTKQNIITSQIRLPSKPWDTALVPRDVTEESSTYDLIVTLPGARKLHYVRVTGDQIKDTNKDISVEGSCYGIQVTQDRKLAVSYDDLLSEKVEILDMDGQVLRRLVTGHGGPRLLRPYYLAVSPDSGILYVSDWGYGTLTSINIRHGSVMTKLKGLRKPRGVTVDRAGSVFVCCFDGTVHLVAATGDRSTQILGKEDGLCGEPRAICLSPEGDRMYVSGYRSDHVQEFQLTEN